ncbi:uncharacterized protein LOC109792773 [Cajanus cajan]|uniref:Uncharacterized protein n=1 Tax=Cajanus cajan TaxID=3821 RepID=A0A151UIR5_CAJCA|nr:uncharacterized protein LOC109792773 [Cajanus cajan]
MQVPLIDRINDLQVGLNSLQNPSFPSQITTSLASVSIAYNFCKWGAVILALVATFGSIINRVTILIIRLRSKAPSLPSLVDDDDVFTSDDDDDDYQNDDDDLTYSSSEPEDEPSASSSFICLDNYFRVRGTANNNNNSSSLDDEFRNQNGMHKRRRSIGDIFSLAELANSKSVVKLWDSIGFGLGLDFDDYEDGVVSGSHAPPPAASSTTSPAVVVSAGEGVCGNLAVEIWDTRLRRRKPTVVAEWGPTVAKTLRVESGGVQKVYVRDDGRYAVMVGDMRKVSTPLGNVTESDADTWWDADAIVVSDESFGEQQPT